MAIVSTDQDSSLGAKAKRLRVCQLLTQQELAQIAGISEEEVNLFEHNLPVQFEARHKLLRELCLRITHNS